MLALLREKMVLDKKYQTQALNNFAGCSVWPEGFLATFGILVRSARILPHKLFQLLLFLLQSVFLTIDIEDNMPDQRRYLTPKPSLELSCTCRASTLSAEQH